MGLALDFAFAIHSCHCTTKIHAIKSRKSSIPILKRINASTTPLFSLISFGIEAWVILALGMSH